MCCHSSFFWNENVPTSISQMMARKREFFCVQSRDLIKPKMPAKIVFVVAGGGGGGARIRRIKVDDIMEKKDTKIKLSTTQMGKLSESL